MKVFRDIFAAIMVGIIGGFLVTTFSYYHDHKEGGVTQTLFAVLDSFNTVADAYSSANGDSLLGNIEDVDLEDEVLAAFESVENGEVTSVSGEVLKSILSESSSLSAEGDVLMMEGEDGETSSGEPYSGILRFHVRANSDSDEDQALKIAVKEDVVTMLKPLLSDCENVTESKNVIVANLQNIYTTAVNTIVEQGYDYTVKVYVTEEEFPAKTYGDLTFPEGDYQALRIDIGAAKGQNWWCVMYPPLCFIDESTAVVSEEGKEELKEALTAEEYAALFAYCKDGENEEGNDITVKGESWLYNLITGK